MRVQGQGPGLTYYPRKAAIFPLHEWLGDFEEESNPSLNHYSGPRGRRKGVRVKLLCIDELAYTGLDQCRAEILTWS